MNRLLLALLISALSFGQPAQLGQKAADHPRRLPERLRSRFWKAQTDLLLMQRNLDAIRSEMVKACSPKQLVADSTGDPICEGETQND